MTTLRVPLLKSAGPGMPPIPVDGEVVPLDRTRHLAAAAKWRPVLAAHAEEDAKWDWSAHLQEADTNQAKGVGQYEAYALECEGELHALMLLEIADWKSRQSGDPIVYVEYVAIAPWDRRGIQNPPRIAGCGRGIISMAIQRSNELGYKGAIALHSLPGAVGFYARLRLKDLGPDPQEKGLHYFELL